MSSTDAIENLRPYGCEEQPKSEAVERMFDSIAPTYDYMNRAMTFGLHVRWRNRALEKLGLEPGARVLDVATGTGDVAFRIYEKYSPRSVTGIDLSRGMLRIAREKLSTLPAEASEVISFGVGDSLCMPFADGSMDAVTVAYGVRNFEHLDQGLREMARVLRSGGKLCIIELSEPRNRFTRSLYRFYSRRLIPLIGRRVSGDSDAYTYLPMSIAAAPQREGLVALMINAGLTSCEWHSMTFGAVTVYLGTKP